MSDLLTELSHPTSDVLGLLRRAKAEIERLTAQLNDELDAVALIEALCNDGYGDTLLDCLRQAVEAKRKAGKS